MNKTHNTSIPFTLSALAGFIVSMAFTLITGSREAWDHGAYFYVGIPLMCVLIFLLAYRFPHHAWRWTLAMALGQGVALFLNNHAFNLWPLALMSLALLSLPQLLTGIIAAYFGRKRLAS